MTTAQTKTKPAIDGAMLMKRAEDAFTLKTPWQAVLREMFALTMAARNPYDTQKTGLVSLNSQFDATAPMSLFKATNRLMSELVPADQNWLELDVGPVLANKLSDQQKQQYRQLLTATTNIAHTVFDGSNFINAQWEAFMEMLGGIMGCMLVLEDPDDDLAPVNFECVSQKEVAIELDGKGKICGVYRRRDAIKIRNITTVWADAKLPKDLQDQLKNAKGGKNSDPSCELTEATYRIPKSGGKWAYIVLYKGGKGSDPAQLVYREYDENPWIIYQWSRMPNSPYGPGPGILLLPAIRMVNKVRQMIVMNAALALAGMYLAKDDGVLNIDGIQIVQGGIIPVASTGGTSGASLAPLPTGRDFNLAQIILKEEQDVIRAGLFDNGLPDPSEGVRSPTEILERVRELAQDVGGAIGRLTRALVDLVNRVLGILARRGLVPKINIDQFNYKAVIKSPLARAQQLQEVQTALQFWQMAVSIVGPAVAAMLVDVEQMVQWISERMGISQSLMRDDADKAQIQNTIAQLAGSAAKLGQIPQAPPSAIPAAA